MKRVPFDILYQYLLPQHLLSRLVGWLGESRIVWLKNWMIKRFIRVVGVDMSEALIETPEDYPTFNRFFTRLLKPELRPIASAAHQIASPADGFISQIGHIEHDTLIQAKGFHFNLTDLLGGSQKRAAPFSDGKFTTLYLSPKDYHRVHMPFPGRLRETIYIPGKLFSVNQKTASAVPNLFARNERLVCLFDTEKGPMAVIFVGAMLVGSINTVWGGYARTRTILEESFAGSITLERGAELGHFKMGSTIILLFAKNKIRWLDTLKENTAIRMGEEIAHVIETENEKG